MAITNHKNITIIGAGYVGLSTAALLSNCGYKVYLIEIDKQRLDTINTGKSFFYEDGIDPLIKNALEKESLIPTDNYMTAVQDSSIVFSCVGTPDNPDGSSNLSYVYSAAQETAKYIASGSVFVQKSTVPVGTGESIEEMFKTKGVNVAYVSNPEFLREGTAISDSLWFDRIVAGGQDKDAVNDIINVYKKLEQNRNSVAKIAGLSQEYTSKGEYFSTNRNSAELIKVTSNAFLALKISFANSIAKLADKTNADVVEVMDAVGADKRIGRAFLNAGRGYGGGCFPKDVSGLISSGLHHGVDLKIMTSATEVNESMPSYIVEKIQDIVHELKGRKVAVLGLSFKSGTSDARKSPGVKLANILSKNGAIVSVFDPKASNEASDDLRRDISIEGSMLKAISNSDVVVIATDWPEFIKTDWLRLKSKMSGDLFVDAVNSFEKGELTKQGFKYMGIGR